MQGIQSWSYRLATIFTLGLTTSSLGLPFLSLKAQAQTSSFNDTQGVWAQACIDSLASRNIISGYPDGSFRPNAPVTRAEFAAMIGKAFPNANAVRSPMQFNDVSSNFWAYNAIQNSTRTGFLSGYPGNVFRPSQNIPRVQAIVALSSGLQFTPIQAIETTLMDFNDASAIPDYARFGVAAATEKQVVVNYPNVRQLQPNQMATRADIAAFLCQATSGGTQALIPSQYIAGYSAPSVVSIPAGTRITMRYPDAERIIIAPNETVPVRLLTASDVVDNQRRMLIPAGSQVYGQLQPAQGGSQFVANSIVVNQQQLPFSATSAVITTTKSTNDPNIASVFRNAAIGSAVAAGISGLAGNQTITAQKVLTGAVTGAAIETNMGRPAGAIVRDSLIGAAIATGVSAVVGDKTITPEKVIIGAGAGATIGGAINPAVERVVVIDPAMDLTLTLNNSLNINPQ